MSQAIGGCASLGYTTPPSFDETEGTLIPQLRLCSISLLLLADALNGHTEDDQAHELACHTAVPHYQELQWSPIERQGCRGP